MHFRIALNRLQCALAYCIGSEMLAFRIGTGRAAGLAEFRDASPHQSRDFALTILQPSCGTTFSCLC
jgi:hypothetical protein